MLGSDRITVAVTVAYIASRTADAVIKRRGRPADHSLGDQTTSPSSAAAYFTRVILCSKQIGVLTHSSAHTPHG